MQMGVDYVKGGGLCKRGWVVQKGVGYAKGGGLVGYAKGSEFCKIKGAGDSEPVTLHNISLTAYSFTIEIAECLQQTVNYRQ